MSSFDERLSASDPARDGYTHPAMGAMISRVVATGRPRRDAAWRAFRLKIASAVAGTGVVTGAGILALSSAGVSLPVLSFAAATTHTSSAGSIYGTSTAPNAMLMPLQRNWQITGADNVSDAPGSAVVYTLSAPSDLAGTLSQAAQVLGVDIGAPSTNGDDQSYSATGQNYSGWLESNDGFASWGISLNSSTTSAAASGPVSLDQFNATALSDAQQLGTFELGAPSPQALGDNNTGPVDVTVPILVDHEQTDFAYDFTFGSDGSLQSADGVAATLSPLATYPLVSPSAGVGEILSQLYVTTAPMGGGFATPMLGSSSNTTAPSAGSSDATTTVPVNGTDSTPPDSVPTTDPTTSTIPPTVVNITGVTDQYGAYSMSGGTTLLLPVYVYNGDVVGQTWQASFRVIAVDPAYLDLSSIVSARLF